ncbi:MAG TPA: GntR family transcriptional regulator [Sphingomicrobium sp.]|nr:GntR family transcriptional regulator [Sphingomicrobium sp.]
MTPPGTFERVYAAIKQRLRIGFYRPGEKLEPAVLSDELNASVTPVRDALHRLTGERLVEAPRHEGFRTPMITETMLRHLYVWHRDLLILALVNRWSHVPQCHEELSSSANGVGERQRAFFRMLASMSGNPEHLHAFEALSDRLEPFHRLEGALLDAIEEETEEIGVALRSANRAQLRRALIRYHRRRERIVPELLERLYGR